LLLFQILNLYRYTVDPEAFEVSCAGLQVALPAPTFRACPSCSTPTVTSSLLSCDDLKLVMAGLYKLNPVDT
jgi:hypothetical protein